MLSVHYRKKGNRVSRKLFPFLEHIGHLLLEGFPRNCQSEETLGQTTGDKRFFIEIYKVNIIASSEFDNNFFTFFRKKFQAIKI